MRWNLSPEGRRSFLEEKSDVSRLKVLFGRSAESVYGKEKIETYLRRNEEFFSVIQNTVKEVELIVDLSKAPERLDILSKSKHLDIWVLYLTRDANAILHSNIKRPKKSRKKWGPKILREALLQRLRTSGCERAYNQTDPTKRFRVSYEYFTANPSKVIEGVLNKIGIQSDEINYEDAFSIKESGQHLYVGNRWVFNESMNKVKIKTVGVSPVLPRYASIISKIFLGKMRKDEGNFGV